MKEMRYLWMAVFAVLCVSCTTYQQQAGLIGALGGAAAGAAFGDDHQDVVAGAAVGAAVGAGAAAIHENSQRQRDYDRYGIPAPEEQSSSPPQDTTQRQPRNAQGYPLAQRTETPNEVLSPYPPHHRVNVEGFKPGQLARDPKTNKIFRVP